MKRKGLNEDLALLDRVLLPLGVITGLLGMGLGVLICLGVL